jgi:hypothetical protein
MSGYIGNILVPQATQTRDSFIATAGQTSFPTSGYTPNFLDVYLNGIKLHSSDFTATNGSDVVLATGAAVNDVIEVVAFNAFDIASGTFDDLTVNNNIVVSGTVDGRDIAADGTKLDGIESGATGDQTNAEIRAAVEAATDSNVFTDADHTKLNAIESGATADQTKSDIDALNIDADTLDGQHGSYYTGYADTAVANIVDSAPGTLDTLNELAAALGDDPNFATTTATNIAAKLPLAGGTLTGNLDVGGTVTADGLFVDTDSIYSVSGTNRVGINKTSPATTLDVGGSIFFSSILRSTTGGSESSPSIQPGLDGDTGMFWPSANNIGFTTTGTERMRIDSSGNLLVGTTDDVVWNNSANSAADNGHNLRDDGRSGFAFYSATANANATVNINRTGSDGDLIRLFKSGTNVGSIGVLNSNNLTVSGTVADHGGLQFGTHSVLPMEANVDSNGTINLGSADSKFKDLHLSGNANVGGTVSATSFTGSGANLTGIEGVPQGVIVMWSGQTSAIPTGWALCDGTNGTPNLVDKFIMGASASNETTTGGANSRTLSTANIPSHTHSFSGTTNTTGSHAHSGTADSAGAHTHPMTTSSNANQTANHLQYVKRDTANGPTVNTGSAGAHTHNVSLDNNGNHSHTISGTTGGTGSGSSFDNRPAYMALAYIMKT